MDKIKRRRYLQEQDNAERTLYIRGFTKSIYDNGLLEKVYNLFNINDTIVTFDTSNINNILTITVKFSNKEDVDAIFDKYGGSNPIVTRINIPDINNRIKEYYDVTLYRPSPKYSQNMDMSANLNCLKVIGLDTSLLKETIRMRLRNIFHTYGPCYISVPNNLNSLDKGHGFVRYIYASDFNEALKHSWVEYKNKYPNNRIWSIKKYCNKSKLWTKQYSFNFYIDNILENTDKYELLCALNLHRHIKDIDIVINNSNLNVNLIIYSEKLSNEIKNRYNLFDINDCKKITISNRGDDIFSNRLKDYTINIKINKRHFELNYSKRYEYSNKYFNKKNEHHSKVYNRREKNINNNWRDNICNSNWR